MIMSYVYKVQSFGIGYKLQVSWKLKHEITEEKMLEAIGKK